MWIRDKNPEVPGYYLTYYYNEEQEDYYFKAFWYSVEKAKWQYRFDPDVKQWWDVRHDYYVPCQFQENVDPIIKDT